MSKFTDTYKAAAALANRARVVRFTAARTVNVATDKSAHWPCGVLENTAGAADDAVKVTEFGEAWVECGGDIAVSDFNLTFDGSGRLISASTGDIVCAQNKAQAIGALGQHLYVFVVRPFIL